MAAGNAKGMRLFISNEFLQSLASWSWWLLFWDADQTAPAASGGGL